MCVPYHITYTISTKNDMQPGQLSKYKYQYEMKFA